MEGPSIWFIRTHWLLSQYTEPQAGCTLKSAIAATTLKSAIAASSRNGTRTYSILLCHFMTQNWKLRCSPKTFRLSFYGIQGVPKKIWAYDIPVLQGSRGKTLVSTTDFQNLGSNWAQFFLGHPGYHKSLTWKFQDCTETFDSVNSVSINDTRELGIFYHNSVSMPQ